MAERKEAKLTKKMATAAVLTSVELIFSYVELLVPISIGIPGIKLGLANIVIVMALYTLGPSYALVINLVRIALSALLFGNAFSAVYALAGGVLSFLAMVLVKHFSCFSVTGVSMAGGVIHNLGQIACAAFVMQTAKIFAYFPVLTLAGIITGIFTGLVAGLSLKNIRYHV